MSIGLDFKGCSVCLANIVSMPVFTRLLLTLGLLPMVSYAEDVAIDTALYAEQVLQEINAERTSEGLPTFRPDDDLQQFAEEWASHLVTSGEFRHRPDLLARARDFGFTSITENVWRADHYLPAQRVVSTWMSSSGHAKNLLSESSELGAVGVDTARSGRIVVVFQGGTRFRLDSLDY